MINKVYMIKKIIDQMRLQFSIRFEQPNQNSIYGIAGSNSRRPTSKSDFSFCFKFSLMIWYFIFRSNWPTCSFEWIKNWFFSRSHWQNFSFKFIYKSLVKLVSKDRIQSLVFIWEMVHATASSAENIDFFQ